MSIGDRLQDAKAGDKPSAAQQRLQNQMLRAMARHMGPGVFVNSSGQSVQRPITPPMPVAQAFRVRQVQRNLLICWRANLANGVLIETDVLVAKPAALREDSYDSGHEPDETDPVDSTVRRYSYSGAQQRTVTNDPSGAAETENQVITPRYTPAGGGYDGSWVDAMPAAIAVRDDANVLQTARWVALGDRIYARESS